MAHSLKDIAILSAKGNTFTCLLMGISKNKAFKRLNNSVTYNMSIVKMNLNPNKTPIEITKEGSFGVTYFRNINNEKQYKNSWKEFAQ